MINWWRWLLIFHSCFIVHSSIALWMIKFIVLEGTINLVQEKSSVPLHGIERIRVNFALGRRIGFCTNLSALSFSAKQEELWNSAPLSSTRLDPLLFPIPTRTRFFLLFIPLIVFFDWILWRLLFCYDVELCRIRSYCWFINQQIQRGRRPRPWPGYLDSFFLMDLHCSWPMKRNGLSFCIFSV